MKKINQYNKIRKNKIIKKIRCTHYEILHFMCETKRLGDV